MNFVNEAEWLLESVGIDDIKETMVFTQNRAERLCQAGYIGTAFVQYRCGPSSERGKWALSPIPIQEAISN